MNDEMIDINDINIHITNVCNYSCPECNNLCDRKFKGHQLWDDYKDIYKEWSNRITGAITIQGGEPLMNPTVLDWVRGVRGLWNDTALKIVTNGSRINQVSGLYNTILELNKQYNGETHIQISLHAREMREEVVDSVIEFLDDIEEYKVEEYLDYKSNYAELFNNWQLYYNAAKDATWPQCTNFRDFYKLPQYVQDECTIDLKISPYQWLSSQIQKQTTTLIDRNGVMVEIWLMDWFDSNALNCVDGNLELYDNDPAEAYRTIMSNDGGQCRCHQFAEGKLYRCAVVQSLGELVNQTPNILVTADQLCDLHSYVPLLSSSTNAEIDAFINQSFRFNEKDVLPQCRFCPITSIPTRLTRENITMKIRKEPPTNAD
jgi:organic radical activating enzyme